MMKNILPLFLILGFYSTAISQTAKETSILIELMGKSGKEEKKMINQLEKADELRLYAKEYGGFLCSYVYPDDEVRGIEALERRYVSKIYIYKSCFEFFDNDLPFGLAVDEPFKQVKKRLKKNKNIINLRTRDNPDRMSFTYIGNSPFEGKNGIDVQLQFEWGEDFPFKEMTLSEPD